MERVCSALAIACSVMLLIGASNARGQYLYLDTDGNGVPTAADKVTIPGTTNVGIWLRTDVNRDGSAAACGGAGTMTLNSYEFTLRVENGTVRWGTYTNEQSATMPTLLGSSSSPTEFYIGYGGSTALSPGTYKLGTVPMFVTYGSPTIAIASDSTSSHRTTFGSSCAGVGGNNTLTLGQDWLDADGLAAAAFTVLLVEDFEGATTYNLPSNWQTTTAGGPDWGPSTQSCGYVKTGTYGASGAGIFHCLDYPSGINNSLKRSTCTNVSRLSKYQVSFQGRRRLSTDTTDGSDKFWSGYLAGTDCSFLQSTGVNAWYGVADSWVNYTGGEVDNSDDFTLPYRWVKPIFGMETFHNSPASPVHGAWIDDIQLYGTSRPDLVIVGSPSAYGASGPSAPLQTDTAWKAKFSIKNLGQLPTSTFDARSFSVRISLVPASGGSATVVGTYFDAGLIAGAQRDVVADMPVWASSGQYKLVLEVDSGNNVLESTVDDSPELNNNYTTTSIFTWSLPPSRDLVITSFTLSNATAALGDTVTATARIKNQGTVSCPGTTLGFYKNPGGVPTTATSPTQTLAIPTLASGDSTTAQFKITSLALEVASLYLLADRAGVVTETNASGTGESNNAAGPRTVQWSGGTFTVQGTFVYGDSVNGNVDTYVPCSTVEVWHDDSSGTDSLLATGTINIADGSFRIGPIANVDASPGPGGDAVLDVYVRWVFETHEACWDSTYFDYAIATVKQGNTESIWHFDTAVVPNIPNGLKTFPVQRATDYAHRSAAHILDRIQRVWNHFSHTYRNFYGDPGPVTARWDVGFTHDTEYEWIGHTMYITGVEDKESFSPDEWNNVVIAHEYGHHLLRVLGELPVYADSIGNHYYGAPCNSYYEAWLEGFADVVGHSHAGYDGPIHSAPLIVAERGGRSPSGATSTLRMDIERGVVEEIGVFPSKTYVDNDKGALFEYAVASMLWDVGDNAADNPNADDYGDNYWGGWGAVWQVPLVYATGITHVCSYSSALLSLWGGDATERQKALAVLGEHGIVCNAAGVPTGVAVGDGTRALALRPATPNPSNPRTLLRFELPDGPLAPARLRVFDVRGRLVRSLFHSTERGGRFSVAWEGRDDHGAGVASGVYFVQLEFRGQRRTQRVTLLK